MVGSSCFSGMVLRNSLFMTVIAVMVSYLLAPEYVGEEMFHG
jgi:hypothetical protein